VLSQFRAVRIQRDWLVQLRADVTVKEDPCQIICERGVYRVDWSDSESVLPRLRVGVPYRDLQSSERRLVASLFVARLAVLVDPNATICPSRSRQLAYLANHTACPEAAQMRLDRVRVAIVGIGGIGAVVLQHLIGAGVTRYVLVDHDRVEESNLNRQYIYHPSSLGRWKVDVAEEYVRSRVPSSEVCPMRTSIGSLADLVCICAGEPKPDILVLCADRPPGQIQEWALVAAWKSGIALIDGGVGQRWAQWGPLIDPSDQRDLALFPRLLRHRRARPDVVAPLPIGSFGPTDAILGSWLAKDVIGWAAGLRQYLALRAVCTIDNDTGGITVRRVEELGS